MSESTKQAVQTTVAASPAQKQESVLTVLQKMKPQFELVLPKHITPERMVRIALNAIQTTPKLAECTQRSLLGAVMRAAQLGLEPDGVLGQAYLIPFKRNFKDAGGNWKSEMNVQFIPGYKGLIDLARRSGEVSNIIAKEVYANDEFKIDWSQEIPFVHKPMMSGDRGEVTHFWAMARFKDGGFHWDYMSRQEVESIRDKGQGKNNEVWKDHFIEMGKKTAIRRIAKYLPMSVQKATVTEELLDAGKSFSVDTLTGEIIIDSQPENQPEEPKKLGTDALKDKMKGDDSEVVKEPSVKPRKGKITDPIETVSDSKTGQIDTSRFTDDFEDMCKAAKTQEEMAQIYSVNYKTLESIERTLPDIAKKIEGIFSEHNERVSKAA